MHRRRKRGKTESIVVIKYDLNTSVIVFDCVFVQADSVIQYLEVSDTAASFLTQGNNPI